MHTSKVTSFFKSIQPSLYYVLAALFLLFEMGVQSSPGVMATGIMQDLQLSAGRFGLAMGCYFFSYTLMQIPVGLLFDRYPARRLLLLAVLICSVGVYFFAFGQGVGLLALARFFAGFGSAFAFVGVLVIANQWFSARHFALLVGIAQWVAAVGAMAGLMPLAYWVRLYGWRQAALLLAMIGAVLLVLILLFMRNKPVSQQAPRAPRAMASLRNVLGNRQTYWIGIYAFTAWMPMVVFAELWGVPYLSVRQHLSNEVSAQLCSLIWVGLAVMSPILGYVSDRRRHRQRYMVACSVMGLLSALWLLYTPAAASAQLVVMMLLIGGAAAGQILCFALIRDYFPERDLAVAIGLINMAVVVTGALFQPLVSALLQWHAGASASHGLSTLSQADFVFALSVIPVCYVIGLVVSVAGLRDA